MPSPASARRRCWCLSWSATTALTRRSTRLRHHAGQISFPGWRQDPDDQDLIASALRGAAITGSARCRLSADEVEHAFEVPLNHLLDRRNHIALSFYRPGKQHTVYWIPWQQHYIWGATASVICHLALHFEK